MVYGFDENKNKVNFADYFTDYFTYVIDSQEKFNDWVNSVSGNDYSYVAIIGGKGTGANGVYVQNKTNDLTDKTKGIQGFCGAKIKANGENRIDGLYYSPPPISNDYFVRDLTIEITRGDGYGFTDCINLTNCVGISTGNNGRGFDNCFNLTNCTGRGTGNKGDGYGFYHCDKLTNCSGNGMGNDGYGFYRCDKLTNCVGSGAGTTGEGYGFYGCTNLTNCTGTGTLGYGYGFYGCDNLTNCIGTSLGVTGDGYGFSECRRLSFCKSSGKTANYYECYVTSTKNATYKIPDNGSDTPNGGFNVKNDL